MKIRYLVQYSNGTYYDNIGGNFTFDIENARQFRSLRGAENSMDMRLWNNAHDAGLKTFGEMPPSIVKIEVTVRRIA